MDDNAKLFIKLSTDVALLQGQVSGIIKGNKRRDDDIQGLKTKLNEIQAKTNKMYKWFNIIIIFATLAWTAINFFGLDNVIDVAKELETKRESSRRMDDPKWGGNL